MDRKIRVGAVSYLNAKPLIYGFEHGMMKDEVDLVFDYPSRIAALLANDEIDIGLVPVAVIPAMKEYHIITDYCIGADGPVASVCLFSDVEINRVEKVLLDYQSRTSVELAKVLLKDYWNIQPELISANEDFRMHIRDSTAGLVIGDRALEQRRISPFIYDLGDAWKKHTGLPFVFAAWISNKKLCEKFISSFNLANRAGLEHIQKVVAENACPLFDLYKYYSAYISYDLDENKLKGMKRFLESIT